MNSRKRRRHRDPKRVAVISVHTSPAEQPGAGDAGGMNVYILSVARRLAEQGIAVDVFTRNRSADAPDVEPLTPGSRLIRIPAGPPGPVDKEDLPSLLPSFLGGVLAHAAGDDHHGAHSPYDVVHSHYWLSGWVGTHAKRIWGAPHVASFHTLGKVKNSAAPTGHRPEPRLRLNGEQRVVRRADRILAPTATEAGHLVDLYGADPGQIRIVAPGVDGQIFAPMPKEDARARLGLDDRRLLLFVGRLQPHKGPDVAIRAFAEAVRRDPDVMRRAVLWLVGGPSGSEGSGETARLEALASALGVGERVAIAGPQPHWKLGTYYSAAEAVLVPSRSESFGLTALEAQACGTPVVAADSTGLRHVVKDGETGFLVANCDPRRYAERILSLLTDAGLARRMAEAGPRHAGEFSWDSTVQGVRGVYGELLNGDAA
ncbi:MAG TPA: glycosyltransferase [Actinomycetota bacterium]|nr:glycosyltransferase [Actinomycetota bacterium]